MSETIYSAKLIDIMPPNIADNSKIQAFCAAFDAMDAFVVAAIDIVKVLTNIGEQDDVITDMLALQQHVDYYNQALPAETRHDLVKNSGFVHHIKGTPAAVEKVAQLVFGSATVQEWFEYGGVPYHFRVLINEFPNSDKQIGEVHRAIDCSKNTRSWLDEVVIIAATTSGQFFAGGVIQLAPEINVTQKGA